MRLVWCSIRCGLVFISARSAENCISVERLNTLNTDLQSVLPNIKKLQPGKQGLFSLIPEAAVHMNFAVNLARFCRTPVLYYIDNHIQNRCSKKYRKIHWKTPFLESLFNKAAGLKPAILLKRHFSTGVFLWILKIFWEHLFYRTPLDECWSNTHANICWSWRRLQDMS